MKKTILFVSVVIISSNLLAQNPPSFIGKWKMVSADMMGLYHNFKNDSVFIRESIRQKLKGDKDSAFTLGFISGMVKSLKNGGYIFNDDRSYQEFKKGKPAIDGNYILDDKKKQLILRESGKKEKQVLDYKFNTIGELELFMDVEGEKFWFVLETAK